jgi:catechol 2,3-dioxygenase-like lactoylglutathione lyase family enzyme
MATVTEQFELKGQVMFLPTDDLQKVVDFYENLFGLELARDAEICRIYRTGPGSYLGFCDRGYTIPRDFRVVITLLFDDVDGIYQKVKELGVETETTPSLSERHNVYGFFIRDPNGYLVEVERFNVPL